LQCRHGTFIRNVWYECYDCIIENYPEVTEDGLYKKFKELQREDAQRDREWESTQRKLAELKKKNNAGSQPEAAKPSSVKAKVSSGGVERLVSTTLIALLIAAILYPIIGIAGCIVRIPLQTSSTTPGGNVFFDRPLDSFSTEAVYLPLVLILVVLFSGLARVFRLNLFLRVLFVCIAVTGFGYLSKIAIDSLNLRARLAEVFMMEQPGAPSGGTKQTVTAVSVINIDKSGRGRTANETLYEFVLPANQWVQTSLLIEPNQEVLVHHFASNDTVNINIADTTFPPLQKAGTIVPLYTSRNCSRDSGVKAQVAYTCVHLERPEGIKFFSNKSVRVGVLVKAR